MKTKPSPRQWGWPRRSDAGERPRSREEEGNNRQWLSEEGENRRRWRNDTRGETPGKPSTLRTFLLLVSTGRRNWQTGRDTETNRNTSTGSEAAALSRFFRQTLMTGDLLYRVWGLCFSKVISVAHTLSLFSGGVGLLCILVNLINGGFWQPWWLPPPAATTLWPTTSKPTFFVIYFM